MRFFFLELLCSSLKVVGVGKGMIGKAIDGEGEVLLYVLKLNEEGENLG